MDEWNLYLEDAKKYDEPRWSFMAFMSNVFNAPQGKSCSLESESCVINFCQANGKAPASYLIQDSVGFFQRVSTTTDHPVSDTNRGQVRKQPRKILQKGGPSSLRKLGGFREDFCSHSR